MIQKFGGWAVANQKRILQSAKMVQKAVEEGHQVVVVVSAMEGQTDQLQDLADRYHSRPPAREVDVLLSSGERMTMALFSMTLDALGLKALSLTGSQSGILTDSTHQNAKIVGVKPYRVREALEKGYVVVVAGFQGVCPVSKDVTTLGRGGSDLTAVALAHALQADVCQLYKGVNGFMTADPKVIAKARNIQSLSWTEACALAWSGAGVLHHRGAELAKNHEIPIELCALKKGGRVATRIEKENIMEQVRVTAVAQKEEQVFLKIRSKILSDIWVNILKWLWDRGEFTLVCRKDYGVNCSEGVLTLHEKLLEDALLYLKNLDSDIEHDHSHCSIFSLVGSNLRGDPKVLQTVDSLAGENLVFLESQEGVIRCGVLKNSGDLLRRLHEEFLEQE